MTVALVEHHLRRGQRLAAIAALLSTIVPILQYLGRAPWWALLACSVCAVMMWASFAFQVLNLRRLSRRLAEIG